MFKALFKHVKSKEVSAQVKKRLDELARMDVFVGIPQGVDRKEGTITQAQLLYIQEHGVRDAEMRHAMQPDIDQGVPYSRAHQLFIHEHGSPLWAIPPRPVLEPAIASVKPKIARQFSFAVQAALAGDDPLPFLDEAGRIARDAAYDWFVDPRNNWPPNAPSTIKAKGSDKPLIDTGSMRRAITYVVSEK